MPRLVGSREMIGEVEVAQPGKYVPAEAANAN